jgi:cytoskeletal protein CcmA (bactofilin family)
MRRLPLILALLAPLTALAAEAPIKQVGKYESFLLSPGETHRGDIYVFAPTINVGGRLDGDLIGFAQSAQIGGEVDGDIALFANSVIITGTVRDSVRVFGQSVTVHGTIEGDLFAGGAMVTLAPESRITGNLWFGSGTCVLEGTVDGDLNFGGGELQLGGTIGGDAQLEVDTLKVDLDSARVAGDLSYRARRPAEGLERIVDGEVQFNEQGEEDEKPRPFITFGDVVWWLWFVLSALIVGSLSLFLFRRPLATITASVGHETLLGGLVGFGTFIGGLGASLLTIVIIITLPLGVLALMVFVLAVYLSKIPVAIWIGQRLLPGQRDPEKMPFPAMLLGVVLLYLAYEIPFWIGTLVWFVTTCLGLGATVLGVRQYLRGPDAEAGP